MEATIETVGAVRVPYYGSLTPLRQLGCLVIRPPIEIPPYVVEVRPYDHSGLDEIRAYLVREGFDAETSDTGRSLFVTAPTPAPIPTHPILVAHAPDWILCEAVAKHRADGSTPEDIAMEALKAGLKSLAKVVALDCLAKIGEALKEGAR